MAVELTELDSSRRSKIQLSRRLVIDANIRLLEGLVRIWIVHKIIAGSAANANHYLWRPIIVNVKTPRNDFRADEIGIVKN